MRLTNPYAKCFNSRSMPRINIQGWRFLAHSYALVNQFQCLQMLCRPGLTIAHQDVAFPNSTWRQTRGILDPHSEQLLAQLPAADPREPADATYRIAFPYNLAPSHSARTVVFATAEGAIQPNFFSGGMSLIQAMGQSNAIIVTPSEWSRRIYLENGGDARRVVVIPHGIDPAIFRPVEPSQREALRRNTGFDAGFLFLHVGAMTGNKNVSLLLRAFAVVAERHPQVRLGLKGLDPLYRSKDLLQNAAKELSQTQIALVQPRIAYFGDVWPVARMANLYQCADAYVSPYSAEGFNLPALEAAACGLPLICTAGGPTDDFTTPDFALRIDSTVEESPEAKGGHRLAPSFDSLIAQMLRIVEDSVFRSRAAASGPAHIVNRLTWKQVVDQLLAIMFPN